MAAPASHRGHIWWRAQQKKYPGHKDRGGYLRVRRPYLEGTAQPASMSILSLSGPAANVYTQPYPLPIHRLGVPLTRIGELMGGEICEVELGVPLPGDRRSI